jgi:hypothetical protein
MNWNLPTYETRSTVRPSWSPISAHRVVSGQWLYKRNSVVSWDTHEPILSEENNEISFPLKTGLTRGNSQHCMAISWSWSLYPEDLAYFPYSADLYKIIIPNVVVKWLTFLLCIWELPGWNLGQEIGNPQFFAVFLSPSRQMPGQWPKIWPRPLPSTSFPIYHSRIILPSDTI